MEQNLLDGEIVNRTSKSKILVPLSLFSCCCGFIGCVMFITAGISYLTFVSNEKWYLNAKQTTCEILDTKVTKEYCSTEQGGYDCFDGHVIYSYVVHSKKYHHDEIMITREPYESTVRQELDDDYPIGEKRACWYEVDDPKDITLIEENNYTNYQSAIISTIIAATTCFFSILGCVLFGYMNRYN